MTSRWLAGRKARLPDLNKAAEELPPQKLPKEQARKLAVLAAGVGARAAYEADQKASGEP